MPTEATTCKRIQNPAETWQRLIGAMTQFILKQGSMLIGKTCQRPEMIRRNLPLARAYVHELLVR
jgi:hypothetical protein